MEWIIGMATGLISGLISGTFTSWYFYRRSGKDLKQEAEKLYKLNIIIIHALVQAKLAEVNFDANGIPIGLVYRIPAGAASGSLSGSATIEVLHNPHAASAKVGGSATVEVLHNPQKQDQTNS